MVPSPRTRNATEREEERMASNGQPRRRCAPTTSQAPANITSPPLTKARSSWGGNIARVLLPGRAFFLWGGYSNIGNYPHALKAAGLYFSQAIVWKKCHPVLTRKDFMGDHEWAFYGWREGAAHQFFGPNNVTDVWEVKKINPQSMVHLTEKPV